MRSRALPQPLHVANEGLAFLLELVMLGALAWWGAEAGSSLAASVLLGVGAPLAAAIIWGLFAAPRARIRLPMAGVLAVKVLAFGTAAAAVYALGRHWLAICFAAVALLNAGIAAVDRNAAIQART
jgi:Protein of unknown function (DUF2568)